jgi:hypothetical protein
MVVGPVFVIPLPARIAKLSADPSETEVAAKVLGARARKVPDATRTMEAMLKLFFEKLTF